MGTLPNSLEQRREPVPERMEAMAEAVRAQNQLTSIQHPLNKVKNTNFAAARLDNRGTNTIAPSLQKISAETRGTKLRHSACSPALHTLDS